ncbi:uncharacterized protein [Primulina huaijiensis]|uniref:uncharacterized protein n=1 Tax=Primulina huaijiensis TaxID=1492673 RepID=UPI003CC6E77E
MISWSIWLARNQWVFEGRSMHGREVVSRAGNIWAQFLTSKPVRISNTINEPHLIHWNAPPVGSIKINVDAAVFDDSDFFGVGVIVRDDKGMVLMARAGCLEGVLTPYLAELLAVREGIILAYHLQWTNIIVNTDARNVVESIRHPNALAHEASIISFIRRLMLQTSGLTITFCRRFANKAAHELASFGLRNLVDVDYKDCSPFYLSSFVRSDFTYDL